MDDFAFSAMAPSAVTAANLAVFDTAVLNMASTAMACDADSLSPQAKSDLLAFVEGGHKLIIYDSRCSPGVDYSWLPYPFTTANPGPRYYKGWRTLTIVEENLLSTSSPVDPHYIDTAELKWDWQGDMNVMTTFDSHWCVDMSGTNAIPATGPVHAYAKTGVDVGLIIYNGLNQEGQMFRQSDRDLHKVWLQELQQPFNPSNLPCGVMRVGITLAPATAQNSVGDDHMATATLTDLLGNPQSGIEVTFDVTSGPNAGDTGTDTTDPNGEAFFTYTGDGGVGTDVIVACLTDPEGTAVCSQTVTEDWLNTPPVADPNGSYSGDEGSAISLDGTGSSDPDGDPLTYSWNVDSPLCSFDNASSPTPDLTCTDNGSFTVTLVVDDGQATDSGTAPVTVSNVAPLVGPITVNPTVVPVGDPVAASADFTDPGISDTHTATWEWGDVTSTGTVTQGAGFGSVTDIHAYGAAGVYTVNLAVTDGDGGVGTSMFQYVVVYDPSAGFVTGGGWIDSPAGAYRPDTSLTGKATFGFVAKYKKGASVPTGNTEFQFKAGDLNFHSTSYQWLVVTGSNFAMFKGVGTINGSGEYKFQIWAGDDPDTFRIKIWTETGGVETVIYDNGMNQPIGGGSIVIHTKK